MSDISGEIYRYLYSIYWKKYIKRLFKEIEVLSIGTSINNKVYYPVDLYVQPRVVNITDFSVEVQFRK